MSARVCVHLLVAGIVASLLVVLPASQGAADPLGLFTRKAAFRVVDHNTEHKWAPLRKALREAVKIHAEAITLQEICIGQVAAVRRKHPDWTVAYHAERKVPWCSSRKSERQRSHHPRYIGSVAVWTGGSSGDVTTAAFARQYKPSWHLGMACVSYLDGVWVRVCSTHLLAGSRYRPLRVKVRRSQAREVRRRTDGWVQQNNLVVIGGDFNAGPSASELDNLYFLSGYGNFSEASTLPRGRGDCRCAKPTRGGRKIDYVFYSRNRFPSGSQRRMRIIPTASDHDMLVSWAQVRLSLL